MSKYLKKTCDLYTHCGDIKIGQIVNHWYGLHNIPITEKPSLIEENIEKYRSKPIQGKTSLFVLEKILLLTVKVINRVFNTNIEFNSKGLYEKYKIYNVISYFCHFIPIYYLSYVLMYLNDFKSLIYIKDNNVIANWPNNLLLIFIGFCIITFLFIINGFFKIYKCLDNSFDLYYIFGLLYIIVYIVIVNVVLPLFINNLIQTDSTQRKSILFGLSVIIMIVFMVLTVITYIYQRFKIDRSLIIKDSLYYTIFTKYISKTFNLIITMLLISSICIKILNSSGGGSFFVSLFLGIVYFIYFLIFYVHIYGLLEGNNYNKIGLYTILLVVFLTFFCIFFLYEMVQNLKEVCDSKDKTEQPASPMTMILTILTNIILIVLSVYLFGMMYSEIEWKIQKYTFYIIFIIYTIIVATSHLYTIKYSTNMYFVVWFIISCIQHRYVWRLFKYICCLIISLFKEV